MKGSRSLSHLNALRALEAVIRRGSFNAAAAELAMTPAAVSQKIRQLETYLGVTLLRKAGRGVAPTAAAIRAAEDLSLGFGGLAQAWRTLDGDGGSRSVSITTPPSIAASWLVPRLGRFQAALPGVEVRIEATDRLVDLEAEGVDLAIRYGADHDQRGGILLTRETLFPVCSPCAITADRPLRTPTDLRHHVLIHDRTLAAFQNYPTWASWLRAAGLDDVDPVAGTHLNASSLAVQAAIRGQGVTLARSLVVAADLASGTLIRPFTLVVESPFSYFVLMGRQGRRRPAVRAFHRWLLGQFGKGASGAKQEPGQEFE